MECSEDVLQKEIVFDTVTTGASNDIEKATSVAKAMITTIWYGEKFGLIGLESVRTDIWTDVRL